MGADAVHMNIGLIAVNGRNGFPNLFRSQEERYEAHIAQLSLFREAGPYG